MKDTPLKDTPLKDTPLKDTSLKDTSFKTPNLPNALSTSVLGGLGALAFLLMLSYAMAGTASQSLFLQAYGSVMLPWVWLAVALCCMLCVAWVNHLAIRRSVAQLFIQATWVSAALLVMVLILYQQGMRGSAFVLYVWKDIYVIILVELFWTFANLTFVVTSASRTYGWFCVAGSLGGMVGNLALGPLAAQWGTFTTLWLNVPVLVLTAWVGRWLAQDPSHAAAPPSVASPKTDLRSSLRVVRHSPYLLFVLALVGVVQLLITVVDFQFNQVVESSYPNLDERTRILGQVLAIINGGSILLQASTGLLLRMLGIGATLVAIPVVLSGTVAAFVLLPHFITMATAKIVGKCVDYSIFRAVKEILYIPLSYPEKTQGKALIDMLVYRVAKGGVPLLFLVVASVGTPVMLGYINLGLCGLWLSLTLAIVRRYRAMVAFKDAQGHPEIL